MVLSGICMDRCGTPDTTGPSLFNSIYNNSLLPETQESVYQFHSFSSNSIAKQFAFEKFMRGGGVSKAFSKSNIKYQYFGELKDTTRRS